jgi:MscS family membrane protein
MNTSRPTAQTLQTTGAMGLLRLLLFAALLLASPAALPAAAQTDPSGTDPAAKEQSAAESEAEATEVDPLSPRASLQSYLDACRAGRFEEAAGHLDTARLPDGTDAAMAALQVKQVLDRYLWFDLTAISPDAGGDLEDGLPPGRELIGLIEADEGTVEVNLLRRQGDEPPGWLFGPESVRRIRALHAGLGNRWLLDRLPPALLRPGPLELKRWQWLALPLVALLAWLAARLLAALVFPILTSLAGRTAMRADDVILERLRQPVVFLMALAVFRTVIAALALAIPAEEMISRTLRALLLVGLFWILARLVDVAILGLGRSTWMEGRPEVRILLPSMARAGRIVVLALGIVTVLQEFGFTVTGLLAGMGLAGMAVALAAQKSIENLLGSATILADKPFAPGDFIRVGDMVGTVEHVGLRSTRIRTLDRTLVTIPNGQLSEQRLETFAARDRIRLYCVLGLTYGTSSRQLANVIEDLEQTLRDHPRIHDDPIRVRFVEFADFSLNLEVFAYLQTSDWGEFLGLRQEIFLKFMEVVEANDCDFAFPTRTIHLESSVPTGPRETRPPVTPSAAS